MRLVRYGPKTKKNAMLGRISCAPLTISYLSTRKRFFPILVRSLILFSVSAHTLEHGCRRSAHRA